MIGKTISHPMFGTITVTDRSGARSYTCSTPAGTSVVLSGKAINKLLSSTAMTPEYSSTDTTIIPGPGGITEVQLRECARRFWRSFEGPAERVRIATNLANAIVNDAERDA